MGLLLSLSLSLPENTHKGIKQLTSFPLSLLVFTSLPLSPSPLESHVLFIVDGSLIISDEGSFYVP